MELITLPGSDLKVSPVCLGTWQFNGGANDITWTPMQEEDSKKVLDKAIELGINFIDTAEAYTNSEAVLGRILDGRRKNLVIATKFGYRSGVKPTPKLYKAEDIEESITLSLEKLKTDYIDIIQVHWPSVLADVSEAVAELKRQQAKGRIRYYSVSNFGPTQLKSFMDAGGQPLTAQLPYNLLWRPIEHEILPLCREKNISVLAYSPLQQGLLTGRFLKPEDVPEGRRRSKFFKADSTPFSRHGGEGAEQEVFEAINKIKEICAAANVAMAPASLSWLLQQDPVKSVIVGASTPEQMEQNVKTVTLSQDVMKQLTECTEPLKQIFGTDADQWSKEGRIF